MPKLSQKQGLILAVAGQKGGVGKSTTAVCLAAEAHTRGVRTLVVDADPQGTVRTWHGVAIGRGKGAPDVMCMGATMHDDLRTRASAYDLVVIDCPGGIDKILRSALMACDAVILPCGDSSADAWAMVDSIKVVSEALERRPDVQVNVLLTRVDHRTALGQGARAVLTKGFPQVRVLRAELGYRVAYKECLGEGVGVTEHASDGEAAAEVRALLDELVGAINAKSQSGKRGVQKVDAKKEQRRPVRGAKSRAGRSR